MKALRYYILAVIVIVCDQWSKWIVLTEMSLYESIKVWEDVFHFTSSRNRGAAFGILQDQRWLFLVVTAVVVIFLIGYLWRYREGNKLVLWAFALVLGGAVGNFIDRVRLGEVVDFLHFKLVDFPIFNIADSAIVIGVGLLLIDTLFFSSSDANEKLAEAGEKQ
ncbi:signal peptidase II [Mechercharimyces sp. CAU 1602]|uniref:signal peptidase II n=1 Tax=Mechercharimyces sp. CAU 1602 TaxID=2973933 RepID=UPI002163DFC6|nr:signal peptidase II [Mechercharimyces sp. CAU 1602]MCS1350644.1 signal peptidase II [Mechercharimyces sp. CAU 1602]